MEPLAPDPMLKYVLAVADPEHELPASDTIDENQAHFRIFIIADVSPGFGIILKPAWVQDMVGMLQGIGYDSVEPFDWNSSLPQPGQAVIGGNNLYTQVLSQAASLQPMLSGNDVIDLQLIGHSRGTSVVGWAMQDLVSHLASAPDALQEGYLELTLLDPHPANASTVQEQSVISTGVPDADLTVEIGNFLLQDIYNDPSITVAARVNQADVYYQQTAISPFLHFRSSQHPPEAYLNLWGVPSQITIVDPLNTVANYYNLTPLGLGHSDVWYWYMVYVIPDSLADGSPPPLPSSTGGPTAPPTSGPDLFDLLYPQYVNDTGEADSLVNDLDAVNADLDQGNVSQGISDLDTLDADIDAAPPSDFPGGSGLLLSSAQSVIDSLGPGPSTSATTIYWTGDAGLDALGLYDWDEVGNWSTADPLVSRCATGHHARTSG